MPLAISLAADGTAVARQTARPPTPRPAAHRTGGAGLHGRSRRSGAVLRVDRAVHGLRRLRQGRLLQRRLQGPQQHELLEPVDRPQLHQLRRVPPRDQRLAEQAAQPAVAATPTTGGRRSRPRPTTRRRSARWPGGDSPSPSTGHVAYVEKVVSANQIVVSEDNWGGDFRWRTITRSGGLLAGRFHPPAGPGTAGRCAGHLPALPAGDADADRRHANLARGEWPARERKRHQHPRERQGGAARTAVGAVVVNVTAVRPRAAGWLLTYPSGSSPAASSTLNFDAGDVVANQAVVGVGSDGRIRLEVSQTTDALVDIVGWYPAFGNLSTTTPKRASSTRGTGWERRRAASCRAAASTSRSPEPPWSRRRVSTPCCST